PRRPPAVRDPHRAGARRGGGRRSRRRRAHLVPGDRGDLARPPGASRPAARRGPGAPPRAPARRRDRAAPGRRRAGLPPRGRGHRGPRPGGGLLPRRHRPRRRLDRVARASGLLQRAGGAAEGGVEGEHRLGGALGHDDARAAGDDDLDAALDVDAALGAVDVLEADGDALDPAGEPAELLTGLRADVLLEVVVDVDAVGAQVERRRGGARAPGGALGLLPDRGGQGTLGSGPGGRRACGPPGRRTRPRAAGGRDVPGGIRSRADTMVFMGGARGLVLCLIAARGSDSGGANPDGGPGPADGSPSGGDGGGGGGGGLVASGITPRIIGVDDRHVYWSHWLGGGLFRAPQEGGAVEILIPDGEKTSDGVVAAGGLLYVHTSCETSIGGICRMPAEGGPLELVHHGGNGQGLTVIDGAVYWASYDGAHGVDEAGEAVDLSPYDSDLTQFGVVGEHLYIRELDGIARVEIGPDAEPPVWFASAPNPLGL